MFIPKNIHSVSAEAQPAVDYFTRLSEKENDAGTVQAVAFTALLRLGFAFYCSCMAGEVKDLP